MQHHTRTLTGLLFVTLLPLLACDKHTNHAEHEHPSQVEPIDGSDLKRVRLTEKAVERLDLKTTAVTEDGSEGSSLVPYSSLLYDPQGNTWVYTSPEPRAFVRASVVVNRIEGDSVHLSEGPPVGTLVVSVGAAELYGAEYGVGH